MKLKRWLPLFLAGLMTISVIGFAGCDSKDDETDDSNKTDTDQPADTDETADKWNNESIWLNAEPLVPTAPVTLPASSKRTTNVSVHDPSIFHDPAKRGLYYAFGTHFAVAQSLDLIEWTQVSTDNHWENLYTPNDAVSFSGKQWPKALEDTLEIVRPEVHFGSNGKEDTISTTWAPDVEYYNGKYYMYYSITKAFGSNESAIGRVEADKPTGPYSNNKVILSSVGANRNTEPNCIDPELFYDKEGKLWMVYGSFMGGIYIKELYNEGENWGLPKEAGLNNWGKRLWLNTYDNKGVEGPFVFYNASTDYYYLMTSADDLNTKYNMRVARSKNPDGPYTDITGKDVAADGYGNKIAGNYKFTNQVETSGYAAMGHNSVIKDKDGRYFVVCHVRRQVGTTGNEVSGPHTLYTFQLYFNKDGWPVMSPNAYVGEKAGTVEASAVAGDYEIVIHGIDNSQDFVESETYTIAADNTVTKAGAAVGTWALDQNYYITLTISDVEYKGVVIPGYDMYASHGGKLSITAVNSEGRSLWAIVK